MGIRDDVFFKPEYGRLYERIEGGELKVFTFSSADGEIYYQYIKRPVPYLAEGQRYYDAMTPYGYGGPIIVKCTGDKDRLLQDYKGALDAHLEEEKIVSEFVRFHPIYKNADDFAGIYTLINHRTALATNLGYDDPVQEEFSETARRYARKAQRSGVTVEIVQKPNMAEIDTFLEVYNETMDRVEASDFYYFDRAFFESFIKCLNDDLVIFKAVANGSVIAVHFDLICGSVIYYHLGGARTKYLGLHPNHLLNNAAAQFGKSSGCKYLYYGCGLHGGEDDPLYYFKSQFSKNTRLDYWQGARVCNKRIYDALTAQNEQKRQDFFPEYRR